MDPTNLVGVAAILIGLCVFFVTFAVLSPNRPPQPKTADLYPDEVEDNVEEPSTNKYVQPLLRNFRPLIPSSGLSPERRKNVENLVRKSGNPWKISPEEFIGAQIAVAVIGLIGGIILALLNPLPTIPGIVWLLGLPLIGFAIPYSTYNTAKQKRTKEVQRQLPEALDLLTVSLDSGQTFVPALRSINEQMPIGLLRTEFTRVSVELQAGNPLDRSLTSLYRNVESEDLEAFAKAVIQAQKLGSDMSDTLTRQAELARSNYEALLERMIARLNTTLFIPLILTVMPALMILLLGPTIITLNSAL